MLHREDPGGLIVITQPAHAWVSGQLARAWGNERFGEFSPWEEVCLGAEQHDIGWLIWESAPTLNPHTGRPYSFIELPVKTHISLWSSATQLALPQGRYAALLVSLHGAGLYERHDYTHDSLEEVQAVQDFLARESAFQEEVLAILRNDPYYAPHATSEIVARNRRLIGAWDGMSLALCMGLERSISHVPAAEGDTTLTLTPIHGNPAEVIVDPWPFCKDTVMLVCEGRRLPDTFTDEEAMRTALAQVPWVTITICLRPA